MPKQVLLRKMFDARGTPYDGAKEHYLLDVEDGDAARQVVSILAAVLSLPKSRKRKGRFDSYSKGIVIADFYVILQHERSRNQG